MSDAAIVNSPNSSRSSIIYAATDRFAFDLRGFPDFSSSSSDRSEYNNKRDLNTDMAPTKGKLKRPTAKSNPPYHDHAVVNGQRKLPSQKPRGDLYDVEQSPIKTTHPCLNAIKPTAPPFSPIRKQKTARKTTKKAERIRERDEVQEMIDQQLRAETPGVVARASRETRGSPRESPQSQTAHVGTAQQRGYESIREAAAKALGAADDQFDNETQRLQFQSFGHDKGVYQDMEAGQGSGAGEDPDTIDAFLEESRHEPERAPAANATTTTASDQDAPESEDEGEVERANARSGPSQKVRRGPAPQAQKAKASQRQLNRAKGSTKRPTEGSKAPAISSGTKRLAHVVIPTPPKHPQRDQAPKTLEDNRSSADEAAQLYVPVSNDEDAEREPSPGEEGQQARGGRPLHQQIDRIQPDELNFPQDDTGSEDRYYSPGNIHDDEDDDEEEGEEVSQEAKKAGANRRKAPDTVGKANTKAKRTERPRPTGDLVERQDESESEGELNGNEFYGQLRKLHRVFRTGKRMLKTEEVLADPIIKQMVKMCRELGKTLDGVPHAARLGEEEQEQAEEVVADRMNVLIKGLRSLYSTRADSAPEFNNVQRSLDLHGHLFPHMVNLLERWIDCYTSIDNLPIAHPLTDEHVRDLIKFISQIHSLGEGAKKYREQAKPDSRFSVVRPVKNDVLVPLRDVHTALKLHTQEQMLREREARERARYEHEREVVAERERRDAEEAAAFNKARKKWNDLHIDRREADGPPWHVGNRLARESRNAHLRCPDYIINEDHNGEPFMRMEVFHPRVGPPPDLAARARSRPWTMVQIAALEEGLKKYAGREDVFKCIFWRYCTPPPGYAGHPGRRRKDNDGVLWDFNVTEIVTWAADLKRFIVQGREAGDGVEQWVRDIPVWVPPASTAYGQENPTHSGQIDLTGSGEDE